MPRSATVLADIHAMYPALEAVLSEEAADPSDVLIVLGDTAAGPMPNETIALLLQHVHRLVAISGNADRNIVEFHDGLLTDPASDLTKDEAAIVDPASDLTKDEAAIVDPASLAWIRALPQAAIVDLAGIGPMLCCHAVPGNDMDVVLVDTRIARWQEVLADVPDACATVLLGHTHMPFQRFAAANRVINPGSVGLPFGEPGAHWLRIAGGMFEQRVTRFDHAAARDTIRANTTLTDFDAWIDDYLGDPPDDAYVIGVFGPRDGREVDRPHPDEQGITVPDA